MPQCSASHALSLDEVRAIDALRYARHPPPNAPLLVAECEAALAEHRAYIRDHFEDMPAVRGWKWSAR